MFGDELSCLSFWLLLDEKKEGYLNLDQFSSLLYAFRFPSVDSEEAIRKEFKFELKEEANWDPQVNRFDFARRIFLNRGL